MLGVTAGRGGGGGARAPVPPAESAPGGLLQKRL